MNKIRFIYPKFTTSISLTNTECSLDCYYCQSKYLVNMKTLSNLEISDNIKSILISGGVNPLGFVPFLERKDEIIILKNKGIKINFHPGAKIDKSTAKHIKDIADIVSFDFLYDENTINKVYKGFYKKEDYISSIENLLEENIKVVPHILCGILFGKLQGEREALLKLKEIGFKEVVLLILRPPGNSNINSPEPGDIIDHIKGIDLRFTLGCMRPGGTYRKKIDILAVKNNFDTIVMPHPECVKYCIENDFIIEKGDQCCVF